jgi:hypothetical protein
MFLYRLDNWSGRLCNNIIQVTDAIYAAKKENGAFELTLPHSLLKRFVIKFNKEPLPLRIYNKPFFNTEITMAERRDIMRKYVLPHLRLPALNADDCLVIHMRGGDIMRKSPPPHPLYVQPPLSFYRRVIEDCKPEKIIILTEAVANPCANIIASENHNCIIQTSRLVDDVATFLNATHVCFNTEGSFGQTLALMSPNIKVAYTTNYLSQPATEAWSVDFDVRLYDIPATYIKSGEWTASDDQIKLMLSS